MVSLKRNDSLRALPFGVDVVEVGIANLDCARFTRRRYFSLLPVGFAIAISHARLTCRELLSVIPALNEADYRALSGVGWANNSSNLASLKGSG